MNCFSKLSVLLLSLALMAGFLLVPEFGRAADELIIGVPHSEKYPYAAMMKNSFEMALAAINQKGGVKGRLLKLVYANDQGDPKKGEKIINGLVKKSGAVMLVGAYQSSNTLQMARIANKLDRPFLICTAADDRITQRKWKNVYRLNPPASEYAKGLEAFFLQRNKPRSMAIVYENSPFGTGGALEMMYFCRENNIGTTSIIPYHKERVSKGGTGSAYIQRITRPLLEELPDVIYMVSYLNDGALLVKKIRELKINALLSGGAGGFTHQKFLSKAGDAANHLLTATLWHPKSEYPGAKTYYEQYIERYSVPPDYHGAEAYSALLVVADVLKRADSFSPESIRKALDATDFQSPFGPVKFVSYGKFDRQNQLPTQVLQVNEGKFECIWPEGHATIRFRPPAYWRRSE